MPAATASFSPIRIFLVIRHKVSTTLGYTNEYRRHCQLCYWCLQAPVRLLKCSDALPERRGYNSITLTLDGSSVCSVFTTSILTLVHRLAL